MLNNIVEMRGSMVGEGIPDHPADDRIVVHLLEGCVKAGREGKRTNNILGCKRHEGGWMNGSKIQSQLLMFI